MTGLRLDAGTFFFFLATLIIISITGVSVGYLVGTLFRDGPTSMNMMPLLIVPFQLLSGFFKNRDDYADWIGWIEYLSPLKYAFQALCLNEYEESYFVPNPATRYGFEFSKGEALGYLCCYLVFITTFAFVLLYIFKKRLQ